MHTHEYKRVLFNSNRFRVFLAVFFYLPFSLSRLLFFIFSHLSDTLYLLLAKGLMSEQLFLDLPGPISDNGHTDNAQQTNKETNKRHRATASHRKFESFKRLFCAFYWRFIILKYTSIFLSAPRMTNQFDYALKRELLSERLKGEELKGSWIEDNSILNIWV